MLDGVEELMLTKRTVLKVAARLYDPLGFVSPVTVLMKMLASNRRYVQEIENIWKRWAVGHKV